MTLGGVLCVHGSHDQCAHEAEMRSVSDVQPRPAAETDRFDDLFARLYADLFRLTYRVLGDRMETEDCLQETFLKLADEPALLTQPDREVGAWLRRVALNAAFNRLRLSRRQRVRLDRVGRLERRDHDDDTDDGPPDLLVRAEEQALVRRILSSLPERQGACLLLRHSGYAYAEIAATLGIAPGSVGVLLARAEDAFRTVYRRHSKTPL
ncbi:MAG: RNA polymerase sigma factor SigE [Chloroflexota bacterium]